MAFWKQGFWKPGFWKAGFWKGMDEGSATTSCSRVFFRVSEGQTTLRILE